KRPIPPKGGTPCLFLSLPIDPLPNESPGRHANELSSVVMCPQLLPFAFCLLLEVDMQTFLQDLRYGMRMLLNKPGFAVVAIITLALGIGANTAIFSVVNAVLLRPLPYREPGKLVRVYTEFPTMELKKFWMSVPEFMDIRNEAQSWESIGAWSTGGVNVATTSEPIRVTSASVTRGLIEALGVQPAMGRNFTEEEDRNGGPRTALIADGLWRSAFGADREIIGKEIQINARPFTVIGVMPRDFNFPAGSNDPAQ